MNLWSSRESLNPVLAKLYNGFKPVSEFNWDSMTSIPLYSLIHPDEVNSIKELILSPRYSGNNEYKMKKINDIMGNRGFHYFAGGTNRLVYEHPAAMNAVFKVAIDDRGITDNPAEFRNQNFLKPYCTKMFECTPYGTMASVERVDRIKNYDEFMEILPSYYNLMKNHISGKYVMEDVGIDYYLNFGIRHCNSSDDGLVILDYPYLFEVDGRKLYCTTRFSDGSVCGEEIDWHPTFNYLRCPRCGREYRARDISKSPEMVSRSFEREGVYRMKITLRRGNDVEKVIDTNRVSDHFIKETQNTKKEHPNRPVVHVRRIEIESKEETTRPTMPTVEKKSVPDNKQTVTNTTEVPKKENKIVIKLGKIVDVSKNESTDSKLVVRPKRVEVTGYNKSYKRPNNYRQQSSGIPGVVTEKADFRKNNKGNKSSNNSNNGHSIILPENFKDSNISKTRTDVSGDFESNSFDKATISNSGTKNDYQDIIKDDDARIDEIANTIVNAIFGSGDSNGEESNKDLFVPKSVDMAKASKDETIEAKKYNHKRRGTTTTTAKEEDLSVQEEEKKTEVDSVTVEVTAVEEKPKKKTTTRKTTTKKSTVVKPKKKAVSNVDDDSTSDLVSNTKKSINEEEN